MGKQLMILGTFHMESQGDVHNVSDTEKIFNHEEEMRSIVEKLSAYKPTKIFVEIEKTKQDYLDDIYQKFLSGKIHSTNEIVQLAFPLAKENSSKLIAIDWMEQGAGKIACGDVMDALEQDCLLREEVNNFSMPNVSIDDGVAANLRLLNSPKVTSDSKAYYVNYARIGVDNDYYGMGWLIWWYQRNLNIFANISNELENQDRALLLIGAAHKGLLEELFSDSKSVTLIDSLEYI